MACRCALRHRSPSTLDAVAFTDEQVSEFDEQAADLNRQERGDQFEAYLRRADD